MKALVIYDSKFGHTEQIARAVGDTLAQEFTVTVVSAAEAAPLPPEIDLLVIGGPTHAHGASEPMDALLDTLGQGALVGVAAAAFDTRFQMPRWLSGSAARVITKHLLQAGCTMVLPPESFFVERTDDAALLPGELERASTWARAVLAATPRPVAGRPNR